METKKKVYVLLAAVLWIVLLFLLYSQNDGAKTAQRAKPVVAMPVQEPEIPKTLTNSLGMTFAYIPRGTFMMGSPPDELGRYDREAQHEVTLSQGFYMQTTEVTQRQWEMVMKSKPSHFRDCDEACPVEQISWNNVHRFVWRLNHMEGEYRYTLPTEAEWEYACRAGTTTRFHWGDEGDCDKANYGVGFIHGECRRINPGKPMRVGSFPPNPWGLHDMHGNVAEWCLDRFADYPLKHMTNPVGGYVGTDQVYRGGSWGVASRYCRSANRDADRPGAKFSEVGFRVVRSASNYGLRRNRLKYTPPYP